LNALKAKIVRLHNGKSTQLLLGVHDQDKHIDEQPTLYQVLKQRKRQTSRLILNVRDADGTTHTSPRAILRTFVDRMKSKYEDIQVDPGNVHSMLRGLRRTISAEANAAFGTPINLEELHAEVEQGKKLKAPGYDGICHEFFQ
jgi:glutamine synthetase